VTAEWYYTEVSHGKSAADGVRKNMLSMLFKFLNTQLITNFHNGQEEFEITQNNTKWVIIATY
jgi:hypothetical protein